MRTTPVAPCRETRTFIANKIHSGCFAVATLSMAPRYSKGLGGDSGRCSTDAEDVAGFCGKRGVMETGGEAVGLGGGEDGGGGGVVVAVGEDGAAGMSR